MKKALPLISVGLLLILAFPGKAFAYLDPGTGSMVVQGTIAVIAALGVSVGILWKRLKNLLGQKKNQSEAQKKDEI